MIGHGNCHPLFTPPLRLLCLLAAASGVNTFVKDYVNDKILRLMIVATSERGQSVASFMLVLFFAIVAAGIAAILLYSGDIGGGHRPEMEPPNFNPPNPLD
jgi:hypothetical protein